MRSKWIRVKSVALSRSRTRRIAAVQLAIHSKRALSHCIDSSDHDTGIVSSELTESMFWSERLPITAFFFPTTNKDYFLTMSSPVRLSRSRRILSRSGSRPSVRSNSSSSPSSSSSKFATPHASVDNDSDDSPNPRVRRSPSPSRSRRSRASTKSASRRRSVSRSTDGAPGDVLEIRHASPTRLRPHKQTRFGIPAPTNQPRIIGKLSTNASGGVVMLKSHRKFRFRGKVPRGPDLRGTRPERSRMASQLGRMRSVRQRYGHGSSRWSRSHASFREQSSLRMLFYQLITARPVSSPRFSPRSWLRRHRLFRTTFPPSLQHYCWRWLRYSGR